MGKKITKTIERLTEEFFAAERAEYEKRVPQAFPRVEVRGLDDMPAAEETPPEVEEAKPEKES